MKKKKQVLPFNLQLCSINYWKSILCMVGKNQCLTRIQSWNCFHIKFQPVIVIVITIKLTISHQHHHQHHHHHRHHHPCHHHHEPGSWFVTPWAGSTWQVHFEIVVVTRQTTADNFPQTWNQSWWPFAADLTRLITWALFHISYFWFPWNMFYSCPIFSTSM